MPSDRKEEFGVTRARELRQEAPYLEKLLWRFLKAKRLGGLKFRRQQQVGPFFLDFYCPEYRLAVEVDGVSHDNRETQRNDARRDAYLRQRGIRVLRFQGWDVKDHLGGVLEMIYWEATGRECRR